MADSCVNCQTTFEKRLKGYKRQKTNQVVGEQPVYLRLSKTYGISCTPDDFLCQACFTNFQKAAKSEAAFVKSQALEVLFWPKYHKVYGSVHSNNVVIAR